MFTPFLQRDTPHYKVVSRQGDKDASVTGSRAKVLAFRLPGGGGETKEFCETKKKRSKSTLLASNTQGLKTTKQTMPRPSRKNDWVNGYVWEGHSKLCANHWVN